MHESDKVTLEEKEGKIIEEEQCVACAQGESQKPLFTGNSLNKEERYYLDFNYCGTSFFTRLRCVTAT